jgi:hypothetical protein
MEKDDKPGRIIGYRIPTIWDVRRLAFNSIKKNSCPELSDDEAWKILNELEIKILRERV